MTVEKTAQDNFDNKKNIDITLSYETIQVRSVRKNIFGSLLQYCSSMKKGVDILSNIRR